MNKRKLIQNFEINYIDIGVGPTIFCIPSWSSSSIEYLNFISLMKDKYRIIALDLPGFGGNSSKMTLLPSIDNYTYIVEEFINSFNLDKYFILGYSIGGLILCNSLLRGLINPTHAIYISTMCSDTLQRNTKIKINLYLRFKFLSIDPLIKWVSIRSFDKTCKELSKTIPIDSVYIKILRSDAIKTDPYCAVYFWRSIYGKNYLNENMKKNKALIISAENDLDYISEASAKISKYLSIKHNIIKNAEHNHFVFTPEKSLELITEFLDND